MKENFILIVSIGTAYGYLWLNDWLFGIINWGRKFHWQPIWIIVWLIFSLLIYLMFKHNELNNKVNELMKKNDELEDELRRS